MAKQQKYYAIKVGKGVKDKIVTSLSLIHISNDTVQRSIKKASGELGAVDYERIVYEGYEMCIRDRYLAISEPFLF